MMPREQHLGDGAPLPVLRPRVMRIFEEAPGKALVVPADALIPEPGTGRLEAVGQGKEARLELTYRLLGGAFHDGTKMSAAVLLYA